MNIGKDDIGTYFGRSDKAHIHNKYDDSEYDYN